MDEQARTEEVQTYNCMRFTTQFQLNLFAKAGAVERGRRHDRDTEARISKVNGGVAIGSSIRYSMAREGCAFCRAVLPRTTGDDGLFLGSDVWRAMRL